MRISSRHSIIVSYCVIEWTSSLESFVTAAVLWSELIFLRSAMCESLFCDAITVFIIPCKLDACSKMEYELQCGCCGPACFIGLFLSLSRFSLHVSGPLSLIESRREFTGTAGRQGLITPRNNTGMYCMR